MSTMDLDSVPPNTKATILLVEDDDNFRELIRRSLEKGGYVVYEARNGRDGVEVFDRHRADIQIVVSDVRMPVMDGVDLLLYIRSVSPRVPFVMMTGYADKIEARSAIRMGAMEFLLKPFGLSSFNGAISRWL